MTFISSFRMKEEEWEMIRLGRWPNYLDFNFTVEMNDAVEEFVEKVKPLLRELNKKLGKGQVSISMDAGGIPGERTYYSHCWLEWRNKVDVYPDNKKILTGG